MTAVLSTYGVWPFLLAVFAVFSIGNWRAAIMLAVAVGVGQAVSRLGFSQAHLLAGYILLSVVAIFFVDLYSGFVLAAIGAVILLGIFGVIDDRPKMVAGDIMLIVGMIFCAFSGPSGGLWSGDSYSGRSGHSSLDTGRTEGLARSEVPPEAHKP